MLRSVLHVVISQRPFCFVVYHRFWFWTSFLTAFRISGPLSSLIYISLYLLIILWRCILRRWCTIAPEIGRLCISEILVVHLSEIWFHKSSHLKFWDALSETKASVTICFQISRRYVWWRVPKDHWSSMAFPNSLLWASLWFAQKSKVSDTLQVFHFTLGSLI